jgi:hypothetical protein
MLKQLPGQGPRQRRWNRNFRLAGHPLGAGIVENSREADLRGLTGSIANGFRVEVCGIPGPRMRGTGGTLICGLEISRDRGHPPRRAVTMEREG